MGVERQVIVVAGVGNLGNYICDELQKSTDFDVVVLTRSSTQAWCVAQSIASYQTDYSVASLVDILNTVNAKAVVSFINEVGPAWLDVHNSLLEACTQSHSCRRLMPAEWIGDPISYPLKPTSFAHTREPFRQQLKKQNAVQWTLFNVGWLADYFLPASKTWIRPEPEVFPVDPNGWKALVRGTGDELQSWTLARDVGKAVVQLCKAEEWEQITFVCSEWSTFNEAIDTFQTFHRRELPRTDRKWEEIRKEIETTDPSSGEAELLELEEVMVKSMLVCPKEETLRQREQYFKDVKFRTVQQFLEDAAKTDFV